MHKLISIRLHNVRQLCKNELVYVVHLLVDLYLFVIVISISVDFLLYHWVDINHFHLSWKICWIMSLHVQIILKLFYSCLGVTNSILYIGYHSIHLWNSLIWMTFQNTKNCTKITWERKFPTPFIIYRYYLVKSITCLKNLSKTFYIKLKTLTT